MIPRVGLPLLLLAVLLASCARAPSPPQAAPPAAPAMAGAGGYVGSDACQACHEDSFKKLATTKMGRLFLKNPRDAREQLACESCHGPGKTHVDAGGGKGAGGLITFAKKDPTPVAQQNAACTQCHQRSKHLFWQGSAHEARDVACTSCHKVMENVSSKAQLAKPTEMETCAQCHLQQRAQQFRSSHMPVREGKMTCSSCHNPHGTVTPALLKENSVNETCYACHAEKRGPFLWEHAPVVESCVNCHSPHGSNHETMLKVSRPRLCQQCHIETRHPTRPYSTDLGQLRIDLGRACQSCHVNIHGSNHPSGFAFTR